MKHQMEVELKRLEKKPLRESDDQIDLNLCNI